VAKHFINKSFSHFLNWAFCHLVVDKMTNRKNGTEEATKNDEMSSKRIYRHI
jgi:hypothetical protein